MQPRHETQATQAVATLTTSAMAPVRFCRDPDWAEASAAPLGRLVREHARPTDADLTHIAESLLAVDEVGASLAEAVAGKDVTLAQFRTALKEGVDSLSEAPEPLRAFFEHVEQRPDWVDDERLRAGARVMLRAGTNTLDVMGAALLSGYRSSADTRLLVLTGGLTGGTTARRLGETAKWNVECTRVGGMDRGAPGWQLTVHVRLMHALVNRHVERSGEWDVRDWGRPINAADQAGTLGLHCTYYLIGLRMLGVPVTRAEGDAVMHLWRYVGWLMGVPDAWLPLNEQDGRRKLYQLGLTAPGPDLHSVELAAAYDQATDGLQYRTATAARRWYAQRKRRSITRVMIGRAGMHDLALPAALPWYHAGRVPVNLATHLAARVLPGGGGLRWLERRGEVQLDRTVARYFGPEPAKVGEHRYADA